MSTFTAALILLVSMVLFGCQTTPPREALTLPPDTLEQRQQQVRRFDGISEQDLLAACAGVLQDLGFSLDESETDLGLIVASKERPASDATRVAATFMLELFLDVDIPVDERQRIRVSLVTQPEAGRANSHRVRVNFQRQVWNDQDEVSKRESLSDPELYQRFFDRLSKSVFLEAHKL